ncbi:alpha/beta hydrolase [Chryseolinea sp. H1M3-3]|uniref:alpha/beta hydrolase n=1 Tax=Chryseolinea sp. H1M3-3 TaxID=3034144 RepID=UPI0023EB6F3F|nr:alpha/beta hydrolase [Chryseolinea sp. H1M3-3]
MLKISLTLPLILLLMNTIFAQDTFPLYKDKIPNSKSTANEEKTEERNGMTIVSKISVPTIRYYPASEKTSTGAAVIIFPGGGYSINAVRHEGYDIAKRFNEVGITAFVVKYRIPEDETMVEKEIGPLQDAQQAIKMVRENAAAYKIDPQRIGVMGFSAGGHLASTIGTHYSELKIENPKNTILRPDFMILIYPVISFQDDIGHRGSRDRLLGKNPTKEKIDFYSNELQITNETPPTFLVHASDDSAVLSINSVRFYENLLKHKVPAELHIYQAGQHGFGLNNKTTKDDWFQRCINWMESNGWLTKK